MLGIGVSPVELDITGTWRRSKVSANPAHVTEILM